MAEGILGQASELTGIGGGGQIAGGITNIIKIGGLVLFFGAIIAFVVVYFVLRAKYKFRVVIFERVDGRFKVTRRDMAKSEKLGEGGDEVFFLRKHKKLLPAPTIQTGNNIYWYFISDDGEWINFGPGDFDENRREIGAQFLDKEMRYARTSLDYMVKERYDKPGFWERYGGMVAYTVLILVTAIGFWLLLDKMLEISGSVNGAVQTAKEVLEESARLLGAIDTIQSGGAGYIQQV